jgi:hypothetical protein
VAELRIMVDQIKFEPAFGRTFVRLFGAGILVWGADVDFHRAISIERIRRGEDRLLYQSSWRAT